MNLSPVFDLTGCNSSLIAIITTNDISQDVLFYTAFCHPAYAMSQLSAHDRRPLALPQRQWLAAFLLLTLGCCLLGKTSWIYEILINLTNAPKNWSLLNDVKTGTPPCQYPHFDTSMNLTNEISCFDARMSGQTTKTTLLKCDQIKLNVLKIVRFWWWWITPLLDFFCVGYMTKTMTMNVKISRIPVM